jgi:hypothetical protein
MHDAIFLKERVQLLEDLLRRVAQGKCMDPHRGRIGEGLWCMVTLPQSLVDDITKVIRKE